MQLRKICRESTTSKFRLERFVSSDCEFRFYTRFPNYLCFKEFHDHISPACEHLKYQGSNTAPITFKSQKNLAISDLCPQSITIRRLRLGWLYLRVFS